MPALSTLSALCISSAANTPTPSRPLSTRVSSPGPSTLPSCPTSRTTSVPLTSVLVSRNSQPHFGYPHAQRVLRNHAPPAVLPHFLVASQFVEPAIAATLNP